MLDDILEWVQENPETNRHELCNRFEEDQNFAYGFARDYPEYQDFVKNFIIASEYAYLWAQNIGNEEFMKHKITDSSWAYETENECL